MIPWSTQSDWAGMRMTVAGIVAGVSEDDRRIGACAGDGLEHPTRTRISDPQENRKRNLSKVFV